MTTTQSAVLNLYNSVRETALCALVLKLSVDEPNAINEMFGQTMRLVDGAKIPLDENIINSFKTDQVDAVSKKYPELLEKLNDEMDTVIKGLVFPQEVIKPNDNI